MTLTPTCRRVVRELVDVVDGSAAPALLEHLGQCRVCADRVDAARRIAAALAGLPRPALPPTADGLLERVWGDAVAKSPAAPVLQRELKALRAPAEATLEDVLERADRATPAAVVDALQRTLQPVKAPDDVVWREPSSQQEALGRALARLLPPRRSPGWMWRRIRSGLEPRRVPRRHTAARLAVLVAGLLATTLLVLHNGGATPAPQGTNSSPEIVWQEVSRPLDPSLSLYSIFRGH